MTWTLPEPKLAAPASDPALLPGRTGETKRDGWRALASVDMGQVVLHSRRRTSLAASFPEIESRSGPLPNTTAPDSELGVWEAG
ncbi:hypothetical protein AB0H69_36585 [Streptomyces phaeochromogenes]|uniref:hypothetical protein n=1 Tax=Streptomyces phaeochromogenes TaxID=1923 RepID=UPI0033DE2BB3